MTFYKTQVLLFEKWSRNVQNTQYISAKYDEALWHNINNKVIFKIVKILLKWNSYFPLDIWILKIFFLRKHLQNGLAFWKYIILQIYTPVLIK